MRTSIAIPTHNEGDNLWRTVRSCLETSAELDPEIVVDDDGSTDGSVDELRRRHGGDVRIVSLERALGVSRAKDLAVRTTTGASSSCSTPTPSQSPAHSHNWSRGWRPGGVRPSSVRESPGSTPS